MYCNNRIKNSTQEFWYRGMELRQIEFFLQLYKDRNITVASQNLYISQQGMSKSIANLEKEVGFPLFKRSVSGVKPTAEAGELYSYFRTVMKSYAGLQKKVNDIEMRKNGVLSIVWPEFFALSCEKEEYATFSGQNRISLPSQSTAPEESLLCLRQIPIFVTLLLYILIPPVKKNNTSVMVLPQQKYYNKIIRNVVQKIAFKAH